MENGSTFLRGSRVCFTLNNPTDAELEFLDRCSEFGLPGIKRAIVGYEVSDSGTPHLQGYVETDQRLRSNQVRSKYGDLLQRAALFAAKGSPRSNFVYCSKDGDVRWSLGDFGRDIQRSDLQEIRELIDSGVSELEIAEQHFSKWCIYRRSFNAYRSLKPGVVYRPVHVTVLWGDTGVGKTRRVHESEPDLFIWGGDRWFDSYTGQSAALFDDFDGKQLEYRCLLRVLDVYRLSVPVKGGFVKWFPDRIWITSNHHPESWYDGTHDYAPLQRRLHVIEELRSID